MRRLFPDAKVIACVRELPWVIDSIERLVQRNVFSPSSIFNYSSGGTVYTRANGVAAAGWHGRRSLRCAQAGVLWRAKGPSAAGPVRNPDHRPGQDDARHLRVSSASRRFEHDFDHVDYDVTEFDERAGTPGLHTVRGTVKAEPRASLLPPDLFNRFVNDAFWRDPQNIPEGLQVV